MFKQSHLHLGLALLLCASVVSAGTRNAPQEAKDEQLSTAVFAGGCFWCMEEAFDKLEGVKETTSGYIGGNVPNPTYEQVSAGDTGHAEAVRVRYDAEVLSYADLLDVFWTNVDPFDDGGQFCDRGLEYRAALFPIGNEQTRLASVSIQKATERLGQPVLTQIEPAAPFYEAEDYHQDYHQKNPYRYEYYKWSCGRAARLEAVWGKEPAGLNASLTE